MGDFASAANAYSAAISLDDDEYVATIAGRVASYYSNRAACFLQLTKYRRCSSDCDRALDLMDLARKACEEDEKTRRTRCKLHARRAAALAGVGDTDEARRDYHEAILLAPPDLKADLENDVKRLGAVEIKQNADTAAQQGDYHKAIDLYAQAQLVDPSNAALWSNTAVCYLALQEHSLCAEACTKSLTLLDAMAAPQVKAKTLLRRGMARLELKDLQGAVEDYQEASLLLPEDERVAADLKQVRGRIKRTEADKHYKSLEVELASEVYLAAIELNPSDSKARNNRIACLLRLQQYEECIEEAGSLIALLEAEDTKMMAQTLIRRGAAHAKLGLYAQGIQDYEKALVLKENPKVRADMEAMQLHADS